MTLLSTLFFGVLASLVASLVFLTGMRVMRPKLAISPDIARTPSDDGGNRFRIKIVNMGKRAAVDLTVLAYLDHPRKVPGGEIRVLKKLTVNSSQGTVLPGKNKSDSKARHARRIRFNDDLDALWANEQQNSILIRVYARDGVSGYLSEYEMVYPLRRHIKDGSFEFGDSLAVVPI